MKLLKLAIFSFLFLFFIIFCISLFIPSHVRISKALRIRASRAEVMQMVQDPLNWKKWFPNADTARVYYENGQPAGLIINIPSNRYIRITEKTDSSVKAEYVNIKQKKVTTGWNMPAELVTDTAITIQWYMDFQLRWYPWEKFASILYEKQYGPQLEQGLANLQKLVTK
jgi:hypothetical protein